MKLEFPQLGVSIIPSEGGFHERLPKRHDAAIGTFPSGDGTAGGDFNFLFTLFPGDANQDLVVNNPDFNVVINHFFTTGTWIQGDYNGDGTINNADFNDVINNFFDSLIVPIKFLADIDGNNNLVNDEDEDLWDDYLLTQDSRGDFDGDSDVDNDDLAILQNQFDLAFQAVG